MGDLVFPVVTFGQPGKNSMITILTMSQCKILVLKKMTVSAKEQGEFFNFYYFEILFNKGKIKSKFTILGYM